MLHYTILQLFEIYKVEGGCRRWETDQTEQRNLQTLVAIVKEPLIEQSQEGVQNSTVGLEDLIDEGHLCCGQVAVCLACVLVILKSCRGHSKLSTELCT